MGFVFQAFDLVPTLTVAENIRLPLDLAGTRGDPEWVDALIDVVGLRDRPHHRPAELSGGRWQRVAVARAFVGRPDVVFADEVVSLADGRLVDRMEAPTADKVLDRLKAFEVPS